MALRTPFTELVGCHVPVQQAPMGPVATPELAVAVAEAGGLGSVTALGMPPARLDGFLADMTSRTGGSLAANFLTAELDLEAVEVAARRVRVVDFFWSRPDPAVVELVHRHGALASWQVASLGEAVAAADAGCDLLAVQGTEAGGHVWGDVALLPLLGAVLDEVTVPVLAAGGIGTGRALGAVLAAGAAGARVGTRFVATTESGAHPAYKQAVVDAGLGDTEITDAFAVCPLCATRPRARVLRRCVAAVHGLDDETVGRVTMGSRTVDLPRHSGIPPAATSTGHVEAMPMYASDASAAVLAVEPAGEVLAAMVASAEHVLAAAPH